MAGLGPSAPAQPTSGANWMDQKMKMLQYFNLFGKKT